MLIFECATDVANLPLKRKLISCWFLLDLPVVSRHRHNRHASNGLREKWLITAAEPRQTPLIFSNSNIIFLSGVFVLISDFTAVTFLCKADIRMLYNCSNYTCACVVAGLIFDLAANTSLTCGRLVLV